MSASWDLLNLVGGYYDSEGNSYRVEVTLTASDLVGLTGTQLEKILCGLCLADKVHGLTVVLHNGPIGVALADWCIYLKPRGQSPSRSQS